jgi:molecular chaperone GrpE
MPDERDTEVDATPDVPPEVPPATSPAAAVPSEDWETRFKYLFADFENYRRRTEREREAVTRQARGALLRELLPILEGFRSAHSAIAHLPSDHPVRRGVELLDREWAKFLKHEGVEPVAEVGDPFRADECEAVGEAPPTDRSPPGTVNEVVQQGYRYFGGLLRPAKVLVSRATPTAGELPATDPAPTAAENPP